MGGVSKYQSYYLYCSVVLIAGHPPNWYFDTPPHHFYLYHIVFNNENDGGGIKIPGSTPKVLEASFKEFILAQRFFDEPFILQLEISH